MNRHASDDPSLTPAAAASPHPREPHPGRLTDLAGAPCAGHRGRLGVDTAAGRLSGEAAR
jgi:hypothetical protein